MMDHKQDTAAGRLRAATLDALHARYGPRPGPVIRERAERELDGMEKAGLGEVFLALRDIMGELHAHGHISVSTGAVGSSFVAHLLGVTDIDPLPPHYRCPSCLHVEFVADAGRRCGADLPRKRCPRCGAEMAADGFDISFDTFLYGRGPERHLQDTYSIGLSLSRDCAARAAGLVRARFGARCIDRHPGVPGMLRILPGDAAEPSIELDMLGLQYATVLERLGKAAGVDPASIDLRDSDTMGLFTSPAALGLPEDDPVIGRTGAIGIPPFDDQAKRRMLELVCPATFDELIRVHGLACAHEPWRGSAIKRLQEGASISRLLCFRDELGPGDIDGNGEAPYLFPKSHIVGIDSMGFRLAWYKLHTPLAFYRETFRYLLENGRFDTEREARELVYEFRLRGYDLEQLDLPAANPGR